ncbi:uncharacterized protein [Amphiura filiformis]|uniref:uncharacterized protein n=1 Tax=Amphiura filiformis TaxID=82378 RepID=UPI003B226C2A
MCFGVRVNERVAVDENSRICHSCHGCIMKYRSDGTLRPDRVDSQGQQGYHGHQQIGGKRKPTTNPEPELTTSSQPSTVNAAVGTNDEIGADGVAAKKLARLMDCSPETSYLTRDQEILFHQMATKVVNTQASGKHVKNFTTRPARGPGLNLFCGPKARVSSSNCSRQTLANRSEAIEEFQSLLACDATSTPEERTTAVTEQRATMFKRDREGYAKALEKAGFKTLGKFTRETVLDLRSRMPMESWQYVKRVLLKELGINLMGTERQLKEEIKALQFEYECISFNDANTGKPIHAIRAANVNDVITRTLELLQERNQLELLDNNDDDTLWIHISGDKGGKATKILLQVVNASNRHSIKSAKMLGMFEGGKDSRENIELAFKPIFDQIQELAKDFHLDVNRPTQLQSPTPEPMSASEIQDHMTNTLQPLDTSNRTRSSDCQYCCQSCPSSSEKSYAYNGAKYKKLRVTFGGDWEWLARLLGLSGPNGRQFCLHCLCPRADLKKGSSYGMHELNNGSDDQIQADDDDSSGASTLRTYEGCCASNALFTARPYIKYAWTRS